MLVIRRSILSLRFLSCVVQNMKDVGIVPDVIPDAPELLLTVKYYSGVNVQLGNILTPTKTKDVPFVTWEPQEKSFYTLCMTDPDAPSRNNPTYREWHHWLVVNIPGNTVRRGVTLSEYIGSGPPPGTGLHRYVFLLYKQPEKIIFDTFPRLTNRSAQNRGEFSIRAFACAYHLGLPVAGNYYLAEYDDYVPDLYKQLGAA